MAEAWARQITPDRRSQWIILIGETGMPDRAGQDPPRIRVTPAAEPYMTLVNAHWLQLCISNRRIAGLKSWRPPVRV